MLRRGHYALRTAKASIVNVHDRWRDPCAALFFRALIDGGYDPNAHIDVLPCHRLVYVNVPKSASTTIKAALALLMGRSVPPHRLHTRRHTGLPSPQHVGMSQFHRLVTNPSILRFSFVRNPYARLVSAWADKFRDKPLVPGDAFVDQYLAYRPRLGRWLPAGADRVLSFPQFVEFACATADARINAHWQTQDDILNMPGIALDFVGRVETFGPDFARVLDHADRYGGRRPTGGNLQYNTSLHGSWPHYYDDALAAQVYRAYARDFERFGYDRAIG